MDVVEFLRDQVKNRKQMNIIGKLPLALKRDFNDYMEDREHCEKQISIRKQQLVMEMEERIKDEFGTRMDTLEERQNNLWDRIYDTMEIDPNGHYCYNRMTNEVMLKNDHDSNY